MLRCLQLAQQGTGYVAPNPMVGAVLVNGERIIGEGFHQQYGHAHAEVNCINSVKKEDEGLIPKSTLYVSLEPCAHYGKTPPCADLIIKNKIPKVVIGCRDPFAEVNGKGIEKLLAAGVEVVQDVLEKECIGINKRFFTFYTKHRPYIILKWAESANGTIGSYRERVLISNEFSNRIVHKWRSEEASILVGTNTAMIDDPSLNVRLWKGPNPVRLVVDMDLSLPQHLHVFDQQQKTIVFNSIKHEEQNNLLYYQVTHDVNLVHQIVYALYQLKLQSVLVEGGAKLLQSFIDENMWDEARIIRNGELIIDNGISAPHLSEAKLIAEEKIFSDRVSYFSNLKSF
ncbi:MAG: bifunctional diaminohydroxyphosphoribosylaminopyrimidine deaminase/5-amino-6-(5-phosphoribosylamino)uracil reductase RibD [Bacteroidetes bacterium]|nr:bifunctional diaminohydroxyphosphoribosylaminopyrimidine deaminase/5-amino-6-(5-phosphoribosylamino)uracil reductase RibD [Bacteroidota bacterium]